MRRNIALVLMVATLMVGCAGGKHLSASMATINHEYGELQNEALLLNILRRSASLPAHFTAVSTVRGRSRVDAGANLNVPFGTDAPAQFSFNPHLSINQGPWFEVALLDNQEFYRAYLAPTSTTGLNYFVQQHFSPTLLLTLFVDRIHIYRPHGDTQVVNSPSQPERYQAFREVVQQLVDQGLTLEEASLANQVGPSVRMETPPKLNEMLSVHQRGLTLQEMGDTKHYRLVNLSEAARFCFAQAQDSLFAQAHCNIGVDQQYAATDPQFFGSTGRARISFVSEKQGRIELYVRSFAGLLNYLGEVVRVQQDSTRPVTIDTPTGPQPLFVVTQELRPDSAAVSTEFNGAVYTIPAGQEGGQSSNVMTVTYQLLMQLLSLENMPASNTVTIVGE